MGFIYLWSYHGLIAALFGLEIILILLILLSDQKLIDFLFRQYIEFNKSFIELNEWFDQFIHNWFAEMERRSNIRNVINLKRIDKMNRFHLKMKAGGFAAFVESYNASFSTINQISGFNLINQIQSGNPVQINNGILSHAISVLSNYCSVHFDLVNTQMIMVNFNKKIQYLVDQVQRNNGNNNIQLINNLLQTSVINSMYQSPSILAPPINNNNKVKVKVKVKGPVKVKVRQFSSKAVPNKGTKLGRLQPIKGLFVRTEDGRLISIDDFNPQVTNNYIPDFSNSNIEGQNSVTEIEDLIQIIEPLQSVEGKITSPMVLPNTGISLPNVWDCIALPAPSSGLCGPAGR